MKSITALAALVPTVLAATYHGCYTDIPSHALNSYFVWNNTHMTGAFCEAECLAHDPSYTLFGTQWGEECYCGTSLTQGSFPTWPEDCDAACKGDPLEKCGGSLRLSLYSSDPVGPEVTGYPHDPPVTAHSYVGCYSEVDRTLPSKRGWSPTSMTIDSCGIFCRDSGYLFFGLEYSQECWCGSAIDEDAVDLGEVCDFPCSGAPGEVCGGSNKLSIYQWA